MRSCDKFSFKGAMSCQIHFSDSFEQPRESSLMFSVHALKKMGIDRGSTVNPSFMMSQRGIGKYVVCCLSGNLESFSGC